tara:strand:- start:275 stop:748 length:474 start_codon:yes stop_codon:yes gene_type:complete
MIGTVYKLHHKTNLDLKFYIGSTENKKKRLTEHEGGCNNSKHDHHNYPVYKYIRANGGWYNWMMTPILTSGKYKKIEELFIWRSWDINVNKIKSGRTVKEYYQQNKAKICEYKKEYLQKNKAKIYEHKNKKIPCSKCGKLIGRTSMARHQRRSLCST